jgi:HPt (histidine-containing phosphotransfer) domain-containing protein
MVDHELDELRREFLAESAAKVSEMEASISSGTAQATERLVYLAHQLKGSGGSYGFERISSEAAELEKAAERLGRGDSGDGVMDKVRKHMGNLRAEIESQAKALR